MAANSAPSSAGTAAANNKSELTAPSMRASATRTPYRDLLCNASINGEAGRGDRDECHR